MLLADAEKLALDLMTQFRLVPGWVFEFDNAPRRFGCCHRSRSKITLSRALVLRNDQEQVEDCIRHEIAHALCSPSVRVFGEKRDIHGEEWKRMCVVTGANPQRCYDSAEVNRVEGNWQAPCGVCGMVYHKFRQPRGDRWCSNKECKKMLLPYVAGAGRFHPARLLVWRHKDALPEAAPSAEMRRKAIESMKAQLRAAEPGVSVIYQCAKCNRVSMSFAVVCPVCNGDMLPEEELKIQKEELRKRIAELERK